MKHSLLVIVCSAIFSTGVFAQTTFSISLTSEKPGDKTIRIEFPQGYSTTYQWKKNSFTKRTLRAQDLTSLSARQHSDLIADQLVKLDMGHISSLPKLSDVFMEYSRNDIKRAAAVAKITWMTAFQIKTMYEFQSKNKTLESREFNALMAEAHRKITGHDIAQSGSIADFEKYFSDLMNSYRELKLAADTIADEAAASYVKVDKNDQRPLARALLNHIQSSITFIKGCNDAVGKELQLALDEKRFILSGPLSKDFEALNAGPLPENTDGRNYAVKVGATGFMKDKILIFPGLLNKLNTTARKPMNENPEFKAIYFGDETFDMDRLSKNFAFWDAFWLVHEYGHGVQGRFLHGTTSDLVVHDLLLDSFDKRDPSLTDLIYERILTPVQNRIESSATNYAIDVMAACMD